MPSADDPDIRSLLEAGGAAVGLAGGILLIVTSIRDYLLYLDSYDLGMVGTTGSLSGVILLLLIGSLLIVIGLHLTISLALTRNT